MTRSSQTSHQTSSRTLRALLSVSDKTGLVDFGRRLAALGVELLSTGGTARSLREFGVPVVDVSDFTGAPELLDGRVKTLHPKVHGGILGRAIPEHEAQMRDHGIVPIDVVVVNLYPFRETVAKGAPFADVIENIDIGGPAMIRSAAKNHERVAVVVEPADYDAVATQLEQTGTVSAQLRFELARKAFAHTAAYDGAIAAHLGLLEDPRGPLGDFPLTLHPTLLRERVLRYGENPHQKAAFYSLAGAQPPSLAQAEVLQGKELSYNNILDLDAALRLCAEFADAAAVIVKHNNPCGVATADAVLDAYRRARETDPVSAYGGIVAVNRSVDADLARDMSETFLECVIAPAYEPQALTTLSAKKGLRLLRGPVIRSSGEEFEFRSVAGGMLVQLRDAHTAAAADGRVVTRRAPTVEELRDLDFAWRVAKHVKSNAIVFCGAGRTLGVGAGQMSRVDSVRIAVSKARSSLVGSVLASDAFFPFRDGVDEAARAGVTAIIQPGGSVRDQEVIAAADEKEIAMVFIGERHFRH